MTPLIENVAKKFNQDISTIMNKCESIDRETKQGILNTVTNIPIVSHESLEKLFIKSLAPELTYNAQQAFDDIVAIVADQIYEKYIMLLSKVLDNFNSRSEKSEESQSSKDKQTKIKRTSHTNNLNTSGSGKEKDKDGKEKEKDIKDKDKNKDPPPVPLTPSKDSKPQRIKKDDSKPQIVIVEDKSTKIINIDTDVPTPNAPPLSSPTANRPKIQAKRLPPTRRPVQNSRLSIMVKNTDQNKELGQQ